MVVTSWNIAGIIGYLILCIIISFLASDDEKSGFSWFLISILVSPLFSALFLIIQTQQDIKKAQKKILNKSNSSSGVDSKKETSTFRMDLTEAQKKILNKSNISPGVDSKKETYPSKIDIICENCHRKFPATFVSENMLLNGIASCPYCNIVNTDKDLQKA